MIDFTITRLLKIWEVDMTPSYDVEGYVAGFIPFKAKSRGKESFQQVIQDATTGEFLAGSADMVNNPMMRMASLEAEYTAEKTPACIQAVIDAMNGPMTFPPKDYKLYNVPFGMFTLDGVFGLTWDEKTKTGRLSVDYFTYNQQK